MKTIVTTANATSIAIRSGTESTGGKGPPPTPTAAVPPDEYFDRLTKLVPVEVTAAFTAMIAALSAAGSYVTYAPAVALALGVVFTVLHLRQDGNTSGIKPLARQYVLSIAAFLAWGASIRDPMVAWDREIPSWMLFFAIVSIPTLGAALFPPTKPPAA